MVPGDAGWCGDRAGAADGGAPGALGDGPAQTPQNPRVLPVHWGQPPSYGEVRRRILEGDDARGAQGAGGAVPGAAQRLLRHQGAALPGAQPDDARLRGRRGQPRPQAARGLRDAQPGPGDGGGRGARAHGHGVLLQGRALQRRPPDGRAALRGGGDGGGGGGGGGDAGRRVPRLTPGWPKDAAFSVLTMLGAISPGSRETVALVVVTIFCAQTAVSVRSPYREHSQQ